jgi:molybdopterin converting factor subunit 1
VTIRVKLFAGARELVGRDELAVEVPEGATLGAVHRAVETTAPKLRQLMVHSLWAVNAEYADSDTPVNEQSEVALIPPVSGG